MSRTSDKLRNQILDGRRVGGLATTIIVNGYRARLDGKSRRSCPYKRSTKPDYFDYWMLGWDNADNDKRAT
jgi:ribosome modulation factor